MTREEVKKFLPVLQAFAEGKTLQYKTNNTWNDIKDKCFCFPSNPSCYRIKPEPKYRPFKDAEECWQEMQKHKPFGWVIKHVSIKILICEVHSAGVVLHNQSGSCYDFNEANRILTFADGTPFGVKEEE